MIKTITSTSSCCTDLPGKIVKAVTYRMPLAEARVALAAFVREKYPSEFGLDGLKIEIYFPAHLSILFDQIQCVGYKLET